MWSCSIRPTGCLSQRFQNSSRPPAIRKAGKTIPSQSKDVPPSQREKGQNGEGDQTPFHGDARSLATRQAVSEGQKRRRKSNGVDRDQVNDKRGDRPVSVYRPHQGPEEFCCDGVPAADELTC
jgi:hypothetical protein